MQIDFEDFARRMFIAGFKQSGEGYNGEYPFDYDDGRIRREMAEDFKAAFDEALTSAVIATPTPEKETSDG